MTHPNPGYHHFQIGDISVTALNDGTFAASTAYFAGIDPADADARLHAACRPVPPRLTVNAFLIRQGAHVALVDTGTADLMGPGLGLVPRRLAALGVKPEEIGTLLMTHLHPDHAGGLADSAGHALYPNAELVVHAAEAGHWFDEALAQAAPEAAKGAFAVARKMSAPYAARTRLVESGEVLPGVSIVPLPGHTPGHSGYLVSSGGTSLLIWGDIVHVPAIQFATPAMGMVFDVDLDLARATRARALDMAATDKIMVAGMHLEFPATGNVVRDGDAYRFVPALWLTE
jgi:glyoxylase-like metal-dependent hydrolase (beta-lactamase superfamily II)